ncbi:hypothetical protein Q4577_20540 [Marinovum sp. 2_MG-2023]|uniref:hypothetical protein n=1 Tax=Roseobacteraceae TaxID=2854170 RepID=UPI001FD1ECCA|nr:MULTISPECIES: hypothetical protein [Roseobacteraceae]MCJ7871532.1 hypothetical protein [Phaeobacter sp. J2-8]MDO6732425.1 hypothetical protein [Marinovum sp. 2_MG-2023]MDO6781742.1 hypothetical protein [Marinovum sp. 1_MG-2023]
MKRTLIKHARSWLLLTAMVPVFLAANWYLLSGVLSMQVFDLMAGAYLMCIAVTLAWVRHSLSTRMTKTLSQRGARWTSLMATEAA